jgi:hypothetical protein
MTSMEADRQSAGNSATPPAALFEKSLAGSSCGLPATNRAALAAIGVRSDAPMLVAQHVLEAGIELSHGASVVRFVGGREAPRYPAPEQRVGRLYRLHHAPPLTADDQGPQQRAALENALDCALHARSSQEFGAALKEVMRATGRHQGEIVRQDGRTEEKWLSKSTVSRMVNGTTIARHRGQVEAFIRACGGVGAYVEAWGLAWVQCRAAVRADRTTTAGQDNVLGDTEIGDESVADRRPVDQSQNPGSPGDATASTAAPADADVDWSSAEVGALLDVHVRVTKEHLMRAAPVLVAMGLLATVNGRLPSGQELAVMALLGAAGIALFSHMQRVAHGPGTGADHPSGVCMTAPRKQAM